MGRYSTYRRWGPLGLILALALLMRVGYLPGIAAIWDIGYNAQWGQDVTQQGLFDLYGARNAPPPPGTSDYPPIFMAMLGLSATAQNIIGPRIPNDANIFRFTAQTPQFLALLKVFPVLADLVMIAVVYTWLRRRFRLYWLIPLLLAINPAMIMDSAWWGQSDSLVTLLVLLTLIALHDDHPRLACVLFAVALLTKVQAIVIAPVLLILIYRRYGLRALLTGGLIGLAIIVPVLAPFITVSGFHNALAPYLSAVGRYPVTTSQADNIWYLLAGNGNGVSDTVPILGPITYRHIGLALFGIDMLLISVAMWFHANQRREFVWAAALYFGFFTLSTQMHERYLYYGAALALVAVVQDRRMWPIAMGAMYTVTANILQPTNPFQMLGVPFLLGTVPLQVSIVNTALFFEMSHIAFGAYSWLKRSKLWFLVRLPRLAAALAFGSIVLNLVTVSVADAGAAKWLAEHVAARSGVVIEGGVDNVEHLTKNWPVGWIVDWRTADSVTSRTVPEWLDTGAHYLVMNAPANPASLDALTAEGATVLYRTTGPVSAAAGRVILWTFRPDHPLNVTFDNSLYLIGYNVHPTADGGLSLLFHWYTRRTTAATYSMFVHFLDSGGKELNNQADSPVGKDIHLTNTWRTNEIVFDELKIPGTVLRDLPRPYQIRIGLYQAAAGQRASIQDNAGHALGDHLDLAIP